MAIRENLKMFHKIMVSLKLKSFKWRALTMFEGHVTDSYKYVVLLPYLNYLIIH